MELTKHTLEELKDIINNSKLTINDATVDKIFSIFNDDPLFSHTLKWQKSTKNRLFSASIDERLVKYNLDDMQKNVNHVYKRQRLFDLKIDDYYRFYLLYSIIHELSHLERYIKSSNNELEYSYLNYIYYLAFEIYSRANIFGFIKYHIHHEKLFFERNADIESSKLMMKISEGDLSLYAETAYINHLFMNSYRIKNGKVISPVEFTFKISHFPISGINEFIPFEIAFEHGLMITPSEYHYLFDYVINQTKLGEEVDVDEIYKRIKSMNKSK